MSDIKIKRVSNKILAMEFPNKDALEKYLKEHPLAKRENHTVVKTQRKPVDKNVVTKRHDNIYNPAIPEKERLNNYTKELLKGVKRNRLIDLDDGHDWEAEETFQDLVSTHNGDAKAFMDDLSSISDQYNNPDELANVGFTALQSDAIKKAFGTSGCKQVANHFFEKALNTLQSGPAWERNPDDPQPPDFSLPSRK